MQGFCILCPWLDSGPHVSMDVTSTFLAIAYDRFKRLKPPKCQGDSLDTRRKRSYERTYLTLYNYDRGSALVSGTPLGFSLPEKSAVTEVRVWARAQDAIEEDNTLAALVTLRQNVVSVLTHAAENVAELVMTTARNATSHNPENQRPRRRAPRLDADVVAQPCADRHSHSRLLGCMEARLAERQADRRIPVHRWVSQCIDQIAFRP